MPRDLEKSSRAGSSRSSASRTAARSAQQSASVETQTARWSAELADFPARLLLGLAVPLTLWLDVPGAPVPVCITTAALTENEPVLSQAIVFDRDELTAILCGVEAERLSRRELLSLCFDKWRRPALRIAAADTLGGAMPREPEGTWSVGRVLRQLGATLVRLELPELAPAAERLPAAA